MHEAGYVDYLEHLVSLPILDIIRCPYLDYYIVSIFHYLGSPLNYHTLIFDLVSWMNMYLYNAYIYKYILLYQTHASNYFKCLNKDMAKVNKITRNIKSISQIYTRIYLFHIKEAYFSIKTKCNKNQAGGNE